MKKSLFLLFSICYLFVGAQNVHIINTLGNTFIPNNLTVNTGDTVRWINTSGFHNLNATQSTFPNNPQGFGNSGIGAGWTFQWIFTVSGIYNYQCDPHANIGMNGVVIVNPILVPGCTDSLACNYSSIANQDDGSCLYNFTNTISTSICTGDSVFVGNSVYTSAGIYTDLLPAINGCDSIIVSTINMGLSGCTDSLVINYNPLAICDDGSCIYIVFSGCTDSLAINYNPLSNVDDSSCVYCQYGCMDATATNFSSSATCDDGTCAYPWMYAPLFISEWSEGSSYNKYFEVFNPTYDTIDLSNYAYARVNGSPTSLGVYEYWNNFDSGTVILPLDVFVVAHSLADSIILSNADMLVSGSTALSNGDDGLALVYGNEPLTPAAPDSVTYDILDWVGDWNGDPGQGWNIGSVNAATRNHTIIRKCNITNGDTSWANSAANQWMVRPNNYWNNIGAHTFNTIIYDTINYTVCNGLSVTVGFNTYNSTGIYTDILLAANGCDSIVTTNLTVLSISAGSSLNNQTICMGDSIMVANNTYFTTGTYYDTLTANNSCDSIVTTHLIVQTANYASIFGGIVDTSNASGAYFNGNQHLLLDASATTLIKSASVYSLDTNIVTFELRDNNGLVLESITYNVYPGVQNLNFNFMLPIGNDYQLGVNGNNSGLYRSNADTTTFAYPFNCGPVSITSSSAGDQYYYFYYDIEFMPFSSYNEVNLCSGDSILFAGNIYTTAGQYNDILVSNNLCDSIVTLNLIINNAGTSSIDNVGIHCDSYTWIDGNTYYSSNNSASVTYINSSGCDSIVTLNLTINNVGITSIDNVGNHCDSYTWIDGNTYTSSNDTASYIYTSAAGCDSIITLNLTITENPVVSISYVNNDLSTLVTGGVPPYSYQWNGPINSANAIVTPIVSGNYCVQVTDNNACASVQVCENLTISGVKEISFNNDLILYPNPANDQITLEFTGNMIDIKVYNMLGELIIEQKNTDGQSAIQLSLENWNAAIYSVQLQWENGSIVQKKFKLVK